MVYINDLLIIMILLDFIHLKVLVPSIAVGAIIGKGGESIAKIQKETGVRIKLSKVNDFYPGMSKFCYNYLNYLNLVYFKIVLIKFQFIFLYSNFFEESSYCYFINEAFY